MTLDRRPVQLRVPALALVGVSLLGGCAVAKPTTSATPPVTPTYQPTTVAVETTPTVTVTRVTPTVPTVTPTVTVAATTVPSGASGGTTGQPITQAIADQLQPGFLAYYAAVDGVLQAGGAGAPTQAMRDTMAGSVLESWTAMAADYAAKGYKQTGAIQVESFSVGTVDKAKGTAMVDFCANASGVRVLDAAGAAHAPADPTKRAMGATASLVYSTGHWRVVSLSGVTPIAACP